MVELRAWRPLALVFSLLRVREWAASTVPALASGLLLSRAFGECPGDTGWFVSTLIAATLFFIFFLAFGYSVNDYADFEADLAAGKEKAIQSVGKEGSSALLVVLVVAGLSSACLVARSLPVGLAGGALAYLVGASYSVGPRFKERGAIGVVVSSAAQRGLPILCVGAMAGCLRSALLWVWAAALCVDGLRYILVHQIGDEGNDRASGVRTFVLDRGREPARRAIVVAFAVETLLSMALLAWMSAALGMVAVVLASAAYLALALLVWNVVRTRFRKSVLFSFDFMALEPFYNAFVPAVLLTVLAWSESPVYLAFLAVLAACEWGTVLSRVSALRYYFEGPDGKDAHV